MAKIERAHVHFLSVPINKPYKVSNKVLQHFDSAVAEVWGDDGAHGFAEVTYSRGYSDETVEEAREFLAGIVPTLAGMDPADARSRLAADLRNHSHSVAVLTGAIEMMEGGPEFDLPEELRVPINLVLGQTEEAGLTEEIERLLGEGFKTFKIKVGFDVDADLARVALIQKIANGRASLRLDANQGFSAEDGRRFASNLNPERIELFEQPCNKADWDANAAVAEVSRVPVMMDESIYGSDDIDRCAGIKGVGYVKVKFKKSGGLGPLRADMKRVLDNGLGLVMGDGVSTDIGCYFEAIAARGLLQNAGEMNGFRKMQRSLFTNPYRFEDGYIVMPKGYRPQLNTDAVAEFAADTPQVMAS